MDKKELIGKLNMQRDILKSLHNDPNADIDVLQNSLFQAMFISDLAIEVLEQEIDEEDEW